MASKNRKTPAFSIGPKAGREVRNALMKSKNPAETITSYQKSRSLHSMFAKAFGTTAQYEAEDTDKMNENGNGEVESLDTDSVLKFLGHMGVKTYDVHKRIGDALHKQLENELRKVTSEGALLHLLKNCWNYATTLPEFRPILWAVLKQLGSKTPLAVLQALAEREKNTGKLKHSDIFRPLPPLLKRLVWEADWTDKVPVIKENSASLNCKKYLQMMQSTILYETINPMIEKYSSTPFLVESSGKFFVNSVMERRILTTSRRALTNSASVTTTSPTRAGASSLLSKPSTTTANNNNATESLMQAGKAVSHIRNTLSDVSRGAASYRPNLLHAVLSILMAKHGTKAAVATTSTSSGLLAGSSHLHCTLVTDILLSTGGPLPKQYVHVHSLARLLDDAVKNGLFTDKDLMKVQKALKSILDAEPTMERHDDEQGGSNEFKTKKKRSDDSEDKSARNNFVPNKSLIRQLNQIITAGLSEMKDSDPQCLFLNPVTDAIAPGYSNVIKRPMSMVTMENKIENNQYYDIKTWEVDVRLMFRNCIDYNRGPTGQWFRGEAKRQLKIFVDEILPKARNLFKIEQQKRNPDEDLATLKRKREEEEEKNRLKINPLEPGIKRHKIDPQEQSLSMFALASMLLADPFVVRILLDRVLRSLRIDTAKGAGIPSEHRVIPSIMQLLFLAQWSPQICAVRGRQSIIFDTGLQLPMDEDAIERTLPYATLRRYLPTIIHLLRDAELEKRLAVGGDLHTVANAALPRPELDRISIDGDNSSLPQIALALLEGAFVNVCLPGNSQDISLSISFSKFSKIFLDLARGNVSNEVAFFKSLVTVILRHKARLNKTVRDTIISTWLDWLKTPRTDQIKDNEKIPQGSIDSAAHEYLIILLNEWASNFGNILMPRDLLLKVSTEVVEAINKTEVSPERKFSERWKINGGDTAFGPIKTQYERLLSLLPKSHVVQWKETTGVHATNQSDSKKGDEPQPMEIDK